jgi:hypothetical protein
MTSTVAPETTMDRIVRCLERGLGRWTGCDWPTVFGRTGLNLDGLTSAQAMLLARATAGKEAEDWRAAVAWLTGVEVDAGDAEARARQAVMLCGQGKLHEALDQAREAHRLESRYHRVTHWQSLCEAIEAAIDAREVAGANGDSSP